MYLLARRQSTSSTCCESEEENKVRRLCCDGCHWENSTLKKYMYGTTARRQKKSKTTLNAYWFRQILDKNDDEYATQATFSLSYFDVMTHIMRAEPIPNDVKFHIILGQNWMKTQAKYDFFKNTSQFPHHFVHAAQKHFIFPTRNTHEINFKWTWWWWNCAKRTYGKRRDGMFMQHVFYRTTTWVNVVNPMP